MTPILYLLNYESQRMLQEAQLLWPRIYGAAALGQQVKKTEPLLLTLIVSESEEIKLTSLNIRC